MTIFPLLFFKCALIKCMGTVFVLFFLFFSEVILFKEAP